ncbi:MAG: hypothetical protein DRI48_08740 [Chloroflexi bacterium]|nr:MAG: hypothetical protein DRI48_08740 [Chloroflexota bacterium]
MAKKKERRKTRQLRQKTSRPATRYPAEIPDERTLMRGMMEMESLADEPEFADFELGEHAVEIIAEMIADFDEEMKRLEEGGDEEEIDKLSADAKVEAIQKVVTPEVKTDIRRRLERLSHRLQEEGQKERADGIAALALMLDFPPFPWMLFEPVHQAFDDVIQHILNFVTLRQAIAEAVGQPIIDLPPGEVTDLLADPDIASRLEARYETDEMLREAMNLEFDRFERAFMKRLFTGQVDLALFTTEELAVGLTWYEHEMDKADLEESDEEEESEKKVRLIFKALTDALSYLNTPDRRQQWLARLEQAQTEKTWSPDTEAGLGLLRSMLSNPPPAESPNRLLLSAYMGELRKLDERLSTDSNEVQAQEALVVQIRERLRRGEAPLPT